MHHSNYAPLQSDSSGRSPCRFLAGLSFGFLLALLVTAAFAWSHMNPLKMRAMSGHPQNKDEWVWEGDKYVWKGAPAPLATVAQTPVGGSGEWAGKGICGIATNMLDWNDAAMNTFCSTNIAFWWNWAPVPRNKYTAACAEQKFVPMIWGSQKDSQWIAKKAGGSYPKLMGYNEPDLWGPPPYPGADTLSAGTGAPNFHCGSANLAQDWKGIVTYYKNANPSGTILSPAMADPTAYASAGDYSQCNTAVQIIPNHVDNCPGWLKCFKENVMRLQCGATNCWDAIDVLQFHAYFYTAEDLINKVKSWESAWSEDLQGLNGRKKKSIWITEFSHAGTTDASDPDGAASTFMESGINYFKASPYVSGWSWFSQNRSSFKSFTINNVAPAVPFWSSELIDSFGRLTTLGMKYNSLCST